MISESNHPSQIKIDGNISDWNNIEKITETDSVQTKNSNIDIIEISMNLDSIYLSLYTQTKEPLFISNKADTLRIFIDTDNNIDTGYFVPGIGAENLIEIYGFNQAIFFSTLYVFNDNRENTDWNGFNALSTINAARYGQFVESQIPLFDLGVNDGDIISAIWQSSDEEGNSDMLDFALDSDLNKIDVNDIIRNRINEANGFHESSSPITIDGYFGDWNEIDKIVDEETPENLNIDLQEYSGLSYGNNAFFYLSVKGQLLSGEAIPTDSARKTVNPSGTKNNYVTTPAEGISNQQSNPLPVETGQDKIYIFLDTNGEVPFGYKVNDEFYANQMIEISGKYGIIMKSVIYNYGSYEDLEKWEWILLDGVVAASGDSEIELVTEQLPDQFRAHFHLVSWDEDIDDSEAIWVENGEDLSRAGYSTKVTFDGNNPCNISGCTIRTAYDPVSYTHLTLPTIYSV